MSEERIDTKEGRFLAAQRAAQERGLRRIITAGLLLAITLLLTFTSIGFIPTPTPAGSATIAHIPAIIGGILEGPLVGLVLALGFGLGSFFSPLVPVKDPLIIILPRLLIGVVAFWVYAALSRAGKRTLTVSLMIFLFLAALLGIGLVFTLLFSPGVSQTWLWPGIIVTLIALAGAGWLYWWLRREDVHIVALALAGAAGSLANTIPVLTAAVLRRFVPPPMALFIGLVQGIPEAIVSGIVAVAVVATLRQIGRHRGARL